MLGYEFFIFATVSSYIANLVESLTRYFIEVKSVEGVIVEGLTSYAPLAFKHELTMTWLIANFYFRLNGFHRMIDYYDLGRCEVLVVSWEDTSMDLVLM